MPQEDTPQDGRYERALEQTASGDALSAESLRKRLENTATDNTPFGTVGQFLDKTRTDATEFRTRTSTDITDFAEVDYAPSELLEDEQAPEKRFELLEQVGKGGAGRIYAMKDNSLKRVIAVKFLQKQNKKEVRDHFVHEAQVTALLEHPNIMPVYDIGMTERRQVYFTMKKVEGVSLGDAIRRKRRGEATPTEFESIDGRVRILLKVCDALAFAHHRGLIHQDIKPDNIMLGEYGEVLVLDWGSAVEKRADGDVEVRRVYGTPAFMSPEQARREPSDERSDVYCLGATMFHALTLRHPTWDDDAERFWEKKREGYVDPVTSEERGRIPVRLLNIALKAMAPRREERYQSVGELADDLKRYQAGLAVSAYRESVFEAFHRWYRRNKRVFWLATAFVVGVGTVGTLLLREKIKELITWTPFAEEQFAYGATEDLNTSWQAVYSYNFATMSDEPFSDSGGWRVVDGALHGKNLGGMHNITFRNPVPGDIRVEWTVTAISQNRDLNCFIAGTNRANGYAFHVGGFGDPGSVTLTKANTPGHLVRVSLSRPVERDRPYRLRMEREGNRVRLFVDGRKVVDYYDLDVLSGTGHQTFGFENNQGNHISIDDVRVYYHPLPLKVSPVLAADRFVEYGHYNEGLLQYREIASQYPDNDIARVAMYKSAVCLAHMDSVDRALEVFEAFERAYPGHSLAPSAGMERVKIYYARGDTVLAEQAMRDLGRKFPGHQVLQVALDNMAARAERRLRRREERWVVHRDAAREYGDDILADAREIQGWARAFGIDPGRVEYINRAVEALYNRYIIQLDDIASEFPEQRLRLAIALTSLGRYEQVLEEYRDQNDPCAQSLYYMGDYRRMLRRYPDSRRWASAALLRLGRLNAVLERYPDRGSECAAALWGLGRYEDAWERYLPYLGPQADRSGRYDEYLRSQHTDPILYASALTGGGMPDSALAVLDRVDPLGNFRYYLAYSQALMASGRARDVVDRFTMQPQMEAIIGDAQAALGQPESTLAWYPQQDVRAWAHMQLGQYDSVLQSCPRDEVRVLELQWITGQEQQFARRHPQRPLTGAAALLMRNRYLEILDKYPDQHEACANALYGLRRYPDILKKYPELRTHGIRAMAAMDSFEVLLERFPEGRDEYAWHLLKRGRPQTVVDSFADVHSAFAQALVMLGRERELADQPWRLSDETHENYTGLRALHYAATGRLAAATAVLDSARTFYYKHEYQRFSHFLLAPILRALAGDPEALNRTCRSLMQGKEGRLFARRLWYEAALLAGEIRDEQFCDQPYKYYCRERMVLLKAIRDDIAGNRADALRQYRAVYEAPHCRHPWIRMVTDVNASVHTLFHSGVVQEFVRWRVEVLGGQ